ncbi:hypothetical protein QG37_03899 [Candidozyma auris]|uniref:Uncharacterized protein n=1 Tax=Candidozyma auris TaxID=498019 RepID=A0A0L0NYV9_CANAR|nr:hypothetical protein QG37_03899 [[Candida] auris]
MCQGRSRKPRGSSPNRLVKSEGGVHFRKLAAFSGILFKIIKPATTTKIDDKETEWEIVVVKHAPSTLKFLFLEEHYIHHDV